MANPSPTPAATAGVGVPGIDPTAQYGVSGLDQQASPASVPSIGLPAPAELGAVGAGINPYQVQLDYWRQQMAALYPNGIPGTKLKAKDLIGPLFAQEADQIQVEGLGVTSLTGLVQQLNSLPSDQVLAVQRNLVAAGYMSARQVDTPGWVDHSTKQAYLYMLSEASEKQLAPDMLLRERALIIGGKTAEEARRLIDEGGVDEREHQRQLETAYVQAWKHPAPPGYVEKFKDMNPDEFAAYERTKESWQESGVAQEQTARLETAFREWLGKD